VTVGEAGEWAAHTKAGFDLVTYSGDHFYLNEHAPDIQRRLRAHAKAAARGAEPRSRCEFPATARVICPASRDRWWSGRNS
jgi:hypothetical protein